MRREVAAAGLGLPVDGLGEIVVGARVDAGTEEVDFTIKLVKEKIAKLRELSPLWEMFKDGIDLSTIQWAAH